VLFDSNRNEKKSYNQDWIAINYKVAATFASQYCPFNSGEIDLETKDIFRVKANYNHICFVFLPAKIKRKPRFSSVLDYDIAPALFKEKLIDIYEYYKKTIDV